MILKYVRPNSSMQDTPEEELISGYDKHKAKVSKRQLGSSACFMDKEEEE